MDTSGFETIFEQKTFVWKMLTFLKAVITEHYNAQDLRLPNACLPTGVYRHLLNVCLLNWIY